MDFLRIRTLVVFLEVLIHLVCEFSRQIFTCIVSTGVNFGEVPTSSIKLKKTIGEKIDKEIK